MSCRYSDQNLLLFIHGDLSILSRWMLQAHLRTCAHCQERQALLTRTSLAIARAIRDPSAGGPWSFAGKQPHRAVMASRRAATMAIALTIVILIAAALIVSVVTGNTRKLPAMQAPHPCRPGIPSDAC